MRAIGEVSLGDKPESDPAFAGLVRVDRHLGDPDQGTTVTPAMNYLDRRRGAQGVLPFQDR